MTLAELRAGRPTTKPRHIESGIQIQCVAWFDLQYARLSRCLVAVPNGGKRGKVEAAIMSREGVRPGYPDLMLDVARHGYHGLRIEMKAPGESPRANQLAYHELLRANGYRVEVARSLDEFRSIITAYLS